MAKRPDRERGADLSEDEVRANLVQAMADSGANPAFVYAFQKTGINIYAKNGRGLSPAEMQAFEDAIEEYVVLSDGGIH